MAKTSTVPRETPDDVPDPRIALAAAIERHAAAAARCKQVTEAQQRADAAAFTAFEELRRARIALTEARENLNARVVAEALGDEVVGVSIEDAQRALEQAETAHEITTRTKEALAGEMKTAERVLSWSTTQLNDAVVEVLRGSNEVRALVEALQAAKRVLSDVNARISALPSGVTESFYWSINEAPPPPSADADTGWRAAIAALYVDATVELPRP